MKKIQNIKCCLLPRLTSKLNINSFDKRNNANTVQCPLNGSLALRELFWGVMTLCTHIEITSTLKGFVLTGLSLMQKQTTPLIFAPVTIGFRRDIRKKND